MADIPALLEPGRPKKAARSFFLPISPSSGASYAKDRERAPPRGGPFAYASPERARMSNELTLYRTLHSLLAVARLAAECRQAVNLVAGAASGSEATPYTVYELDSYTLDCLSALAETVRALEGCVPVARQRRREREAARSRPVPAPDVSRETWPAPFEDEVKDGESDAAP